jgi:hypothetical protein
VRIVCVGAGGACWAAESGSLEAAGEGGGDGPSWADAEPESAS